MRNLLERAEQDFKANKTRDMYKTIKNLSGDFKRNVLLEIVVDPWSLQMKI